MLLQAHRLPIIIQFGVHIPIYTNVFIRPTQKVFTIQFYYIYCINKLSRKIFAFACVDYYNFKIESIFIYIFYEFMGNKHI